MTKRLFVSCLFAAALMAGFSALAQQPLPGADALPCLAWSDSFDTLDTEKWRPELRHSMIPGRAEIQDGRLLLGSRTDKLGEADVSSLFAFYGDMDVSVRYEVAAPAVWEGCRVNAGLIVETVSQHVSYKAYLAHTPDKGFFFRTRLDQAGVINEELDKEPGAPVAGGLRLRRVQGRVEFLALEKGEWKTVYAFENPVRGGLRVRFKLSTGVPATGQDACPAVIWLDEFTVHGCETAQPL